MDSKFICYPNGTHTLILITQLFQNKIQNNTYTAKSFCVNGTCSLRRRDIVARNKPEGCFPPSCIFFSVNCTLKRWRKKDDVCQQKNKHIYKLKQLNVVLEFNAEKGNGAYKIKVLS